VPRGQRYSGTSKCGRSREQQQHILSDDMHQHEGGCPQHAAPDAVWVRATLALCAQACESEMSMESSDKTSTTAAKNELAAPTVLIVVFACVCNAWRMAMWGDRRRCEARRNCNERGQRALPRWRGSTTTGRGWGIGDMALCEVMFGHRTSSGLPCSSQWVVATRKAFGRCHPEAQRVS
jgi:hypothetical protein